MNNNVDEIVAEIKSKTEVSGPYIGVVLGSCFADFLDEVKDKVEINLKDIKSFHLMGSDIENKLIFGTIKNKKILVLVGRFHYAYGYYSSEMATPIFVLKELGCEKLVISTSVGAISTKLRVGDIATFVDHINLTGRNPLAHCDYNKFGSKFIDMSNAYDEQMIDSLVYVANREMSLKVKKGIFIQFSGPSIETPAESHIAKILGADMIGFHIVSEVIAANYCNLPVVTFALVTNYASAYTSNKIKHEDIVYNRKCASSYYVELLSRYIVNL